MSMPKSKHLSKSFISSTLQFAKKIRDTGVDVLGQSSHEDVSRLEKQPSSEQIIEGQVLLKSQYDQPQTTQTQYHQPQHMLRAHLPSLSKQLLGRHYSKANMLSNWISPQLNDLVSDYLFEHLNEAVSQWSSAETVLNQVGEKQLQTLTKDVARSGRISQALANQNRIWAATQGGISGLMGVLGAAFDVPCSLALALRGIYQTGRAYGFELNRDDHAVVEYVFKQIDFASLAEKQALLALLRSTTEVLMQHELQQLQQLLGSSNDAEFLRRFFFDNQGQSKWAWLSNIPQLNLLSKLTRLGSAGVGAFYSIKLVDESLQHANVVFAQARQYLIDHPELQLDPLAAYLAAQHQLQCQRMSHQPRLDQDFQKIASITAYEQKDQPSPEDVSNTELDEKVQDILSSEVLTSGRPKTSEKATAAKTVSNTTTPSKTTLTRRKSTPTRKSATTNMASTDVTSKDRKTSARKSSSSQIQLESTVTAKSVKTAKSAKTPSSHLKSDIDHVEELLVVNTKNNKN